MELEVSKEEIQILKEIEKKVLWLAEWMIHEANHVRPNIDGLKVGGHQASSASMVTIMTALYMKVLKPEDRVAVKPHASPIFHAIQYLLGNLEKEKLSEFRKFGGIQSYPSRTKDHDNVDFSTGSMGMGAAVSIFASIMQSYVYKKGLNPENSNPGKMISLLGDAELDEGNIFEALIEGYKHNIKDVWWVVDYNRQSLDKIVEDHWSQKIFHLFESFGWRVVTIKYGKLLQEAFQKKGGYTLRDWIDNCPNHIYSTLVYQGGDAFRKRLMKDIGDREGIVSLLNDYSDEDLHVLMTNLGGHDMELMLETFNAIEDDQPTCFIAYTIKGFGLPFAGHKDNHSGLMSKEQMETFRQTMKIGEGEDLSPYEGLGLPKEQLKEYFERVPFRQLKNRDHAPVAIDFEGKFPLPKGKKMSTQEGFGRIMNELGRMEQTFIDRIITTSPDVTVSTNLGPWVNKKGVYSRIDKVRKPENIVESPQKWDVSPAGQHLELGIAENNLFVALAAMGLSAPLFGAQLIPIGTLYDPFICRGLDSLNYACYQDARFILVATPSGVSLAPEGGAHQSQTTQMIGMSQPGLLSYEPCYVDELSVIMEKSFSYIQEPSGSSIYIRISSKGIGQLEREITNELRSDIIKGAYWHSKRDGLLDIVLISAGVISEEARLAMDEIQKDIPSSGHMMITSADNLYQERNDNIKNERKGESSSEPHISKLLECTDSSTIFITIVDGHPASLTWLGSIRGNKVISLGVDRFGQSGNIPDLYEEYELDQKSIYKAVAQACLEKVF